MIVRVIGIGRRHVAFLTIEEFNRQLEKWGRNDAACMGGKDYKVE